MLDTARHRRLGQAIDRGKPCPPQDNLLIGFKAAERLAEMPIGGMQKCKCHALDHTDSFVAQNIRSTFVLCKTARSVINNKWQRAVVTGDSPHHFVASPHTAPPAI